MIFISYPAHVICGILEEFDSVIPKKVDSFHLSEKDTAYVRK